MKSKIVKDRCYHIPTKDGKFYIRIHAGKKPNKETPAALLELFDAAYQYLIKKN